MADGVVSNAPEGWIPPQWVKTLTFVVKDLGITTTLIVVLIGVLLGWINSPLQSVPAFGLALEKHEKAESEFRTSLLQALKEQKCLMALPMEIRPQAASAKDTCDWMTDWLQRGRPIPVK